MSCREGRADPEMRSAKRTTLYRALQSWLEMFPYNTEVHSVSISVSTESPPLGSGPLGHGPLSGTKICAVSKEEAGAHAYSGWCETPPPCCPSWRWHESVPETEECEWELDEPLSTLDHLCARLGTCLTRNRKPAFPQRPPPTLSCTPICIIWRWQTTPYTLLSGENWGPATLMALFGNADRPELSRTLPSRAEPYRTMQRKSAIRGCGDRRLILLVGGGTAKRGKYPGTSSTREMVSYGEAQMEELGKPLLWGLGAWDTGPLTCNGLAWIGPSIIGCFLPEQGPDGPKNLVCWAGMSTLFWPFSRRPSVRRWRRRDSLWRITCSLELAKTSQSSR